MSSYEDDEDDDLWWRRNRERQMDTSVDPELGLVQYGSKPVYDGPQRWDNYDHDEADVRRSRDRQQRDDSTDEVQRRERERIYYGDEEEIDMPRRWRQDNDESDFSRRRGRQETDDSIDDIRRRERERIYYGDEEEIEMPRQRTSRRRPEDSSDFDIPRRRRRSPQRRDDSSEDSGQYKDDLNVRRHLRASGIRQPREDEDEISRRRSPFISGQRIIDPYPHTYQDGNPFRPHYRDYDDRAEFGSPPLPRAYHYRSRRDRRSEEDYYRRQRSLSFSPVRSSDRYRAITYGDDYESDDIRALSPPRVRSRFERARSSSPFGRYSPPPRRYRSGYRNVSPPYYPSPDPGRKEHITIERTVENARSRSMSGNEDAESSSDFPKKGKTSIPIRDASRRALIELGYEFEEEGDTLIIPQALSYEAIAVLVKLIREYDASLGWEIEPPVNIDGDPLTFAVNLVSSQDSDDQGTVWNNAAMASTDPMWETLSFDESRGYADDAGSEKVILTRESTGGLKSSPKLRWIHMREEYMKIESLEKLIKGIPNINSDDVLIATQLLRRVAEKAEKPSVHGRYLKPIVLRGDGRSIGSQSPAQPDRHCTFLNFPYLSHQATLPPPHQKHSYLHPPPGLMQTMYLLESTKLRDEEQAICKIRPDKHGQSCIHVPQLWSIVIGSGKLQSSESFEVHSSNIAADLLITYSAQSLSSLRGESIEIQKSASRNFYKGSGPSVLRITDPYQRTFFFSLEQCRTWFELEELVYTQCELGPRHYVKEQFDISLRNNDAVNGATWPTVLASEQSPFIDIIVQFKPFNIDYSNDSKYAVDNYMARNTYSRTQRRNSPYQPGHREFTRGYGVERTERHRYAIRERASRESMSRSRRGTRRTESSRLGSRTGTRIEAAGLAGAAVAALYKSQKTGKAIQRQEEGHEASVAQDDDGVLPDNRAATDETNERHDEVQGKGESASREEGNSTKKGKSVSNSTDHPMQLTRFVRVGKPPNLEVAANARTLPYIQEDGQGIVAEPESYDTPHQPDERQNSTGEKGLAVIRYEHRNNTPKPALERRRSSYVRGDSMALVPYSNQKQHSSRPRHPSTSRQQARPYRLAATAAPQSRRRMTLESRYGNSRVQQRRLPGPRRRGFLMEKRAESPLKRRQTIELRQSYDERRPTAAYSRKTLDGDRFVSNRPGGSGDRAHDRPNRQIRGRPAANGIVVNTTPGDDLGPGIYYLPKKREPIPSVHTPGRTESSNSSMSNHVGSSRSTQSSVEIPHKERRSGSFTALGTAQRIQSSVLPILMWPTGPGSKLIPSKDGSSHNSSLVDENLSHLQAPPRTPKPADASPTRSNDESLHEVLERIYTSLLTDKSNNHNRLFMEMESAQRKDAIYKLPKQQESEAADRNIAGSPQDETLAEKSQDNPAEGFLSAEPPTSPKVVGVTAPRYHTKLLQFSRTANELLEFFVPADYSNAVIGRYYGSIKQIIKVIERSQKHNDISRLYKIQGTVWVIEEIGDDLEKHHLRPLSKPLSECSKCRGRFSYQNDIDASNHLLHEHFRSDRVLAGEVQLWIKQYHPRCDKRRCEEHFKILKSCCNHLNVIHKGVQEIRNGVRTVGTAHNPLYRLPKVLVEAFRKLVLLLVYTSHVLDMVTTHSETWTSPDWRLLDDPEMEDETILLRSLGHTIEEAVDKGKFDLTLMIRTQDYTQSIRRHEAVGSQYILAMVFSNLQVNCPDLLDIYKEYIERLSFQVSQFPRRRLLRSLKYVQEEIESLVNSICFQNNLLVDYLKVLNPQSFLTTSEARISMFDLEVNLIGQGIARHFQQKEEYFQLQEHVQRLIDATKTSVEINDDDHGKAILVFTMVTLVFLPLSFVTSFLGMNTVDIRNQSTGQSLFWMVALPMTAVVVVVALIIGYKYEAMREWTDKSIGKLKRD